METQSWVEMQRCHPAYKFDRVFCLPELFQNKQSNIMIIIEIVFHKVVERNAKRWLNEKHSDTISCMTCFNVSYYALIKM